jgi:HlyD family secretion protein
MKRAIIVLLIIAAIGAGAGAYYYKRGGAEIQVNTAPITRGDVVDTVGATGTLQAVTTVQVGSQVSGNIQWLGADFNSIVKKGQVIAKLDPSLFDAQLQQTRANLSQTRANYTKAQSDLERTKVQLQDAQQKFTRAKELAARNLLAQSELDAAKIAVDTAQAMLASQQATVTQAQAAVTQSEASVNQSQVNLDHTIIGAPIDGIVTQRSVDVGQTVAASMQAPTLFIIAADLTEMQVNANIDEADVGRIRPGQHVTFHVDAYPSDSFEGTVSQIRLQPVVVQNVTTYGTVITVPNEQLKLKPGMTANVKIEIAKRTDVLRIPNASLRFRPSPDVFTALNQAVPPEAVAGGGRGGRGRQGQNGGNAGGATGSGGANPSGTSGGSTTPGAQGSAGQSASASEGQAPPAASGQAPPAGSGQGGRGGFGGGRGSRAGGGEQGGDGEQNRGDRQARMLERYKAMPPDQQKQFIARMKERGQDTSAFEKSVAAPKAPSIAAQIKPKYGTVQSAQTIDALFAPLPSVESRGRAWLFMDHQLKPVNLRLGITDGQNTEVLSGELQERMEVVTNVTGLGATRNLPQGSSGNPLMPGGNRGPGGFGGAQGGRGGR